MEQQEEAYEMCLFLSPREPVIGLHKGLHNCKIKKQRGYQDTSCDFSAGYGDSWKTVYDTISARRCPMFTLDEKVAGEILVAINNGLAKKAGE